MMEKIIQLKESEYNKLHELANLTEEECNKRALKLYEERGTFAIDLNVDCSSDYRDVHRFKASAYIKDWDGKYPLSESDKRVIVNYVEDRVLHMMKQRYGRQISNINYWNKRVDYLRAWKMKFLGWAFFGWLCAIALIIVALVNK